MCRIRSASRRIGATATCPLREFGLGRSLSSSQLTVSASALRYSLTRLITHCATRGSMWYYRLNQVLTPARRAGVPRLVFSRPEIAKNFTISPRRRGGPNVGGPRRSGAWLTVTFLPVLNEVEKQSLARAAAAAGALPWSVRRRDARADRRRARRARRPPGDPRPPLPARRGDPLRRLHRRLVQAAREIAKHPTPTSSSSAACTSWPRAPTCCALPHQQVILPDLAAGCSMADMVAADQLETCWAELAQMGVAADVVPGHLHQLGGGHQGVRRRARRHRLHLVERRGDARVGMGAEREDPLPARSASRPQHRLEDGRAARSRWWSGIRSSPSAD